MIIRTKKGECPFAQIDRTVLEDSRVSWRAKGILAYLLSKPTNWCVRSEDILSHGQEGRDAVRAAMKELQQFGYAVLVNTAEGREWHILESPESDGDQPPPGKASLQPPPGNPPPEKANDWKSPPSNKEEISNKEESNTKELFPIKDVKAPKTSPQDVADLWNALPSPFPSVQNLGDGRLRALKARLKNKFWAENWRDGLSQMTFSTFLKGQVPGKERGLAQFDWFIKPDTLNKILEGMYDDREPVKKPFHVPL